MMWNDSLAGILQNLQSSGTTPTQPPGRSASKFPQDHTYGTPRGSGIKSNLSPRWGSDSEIASTSRNVTEPAGDKEGVRSASACRDTPRPKKNLPRDPLDASFH
jgi:hypothetical protein